MQRLENAVNFLRDRVNDHPVDDFEIYASRMDDLDIESKNQSVESLRRKQQSGVSIRVIKSRKMGMSSTTDFSEEALTKIISDAIAVMAHTSDTDEAYFPKPISKIATLAERPGKNLSEVSEQEKIEIAYAIERAALSSHPYVVRVRTPRYRERISSVYIVNSCGIMEKTSRALVFAEVQAVAEKNGSSESATEFRHHIRFEDLEYEDAGKTAGLRAAEMLGGSSVKTGRYPVYMEPRAAASMLRVLMPSFFADNVRRKKSTLSGKLKEEVFSKKLSIIDDGLLPGGVGSFLFDDEGVWSQRTVVVDSGSVNEWLYDGANAFLDKKSSTGNAIRPNLQAAPQISVTNSFIQEGSKSKEDLILACDSGLWITDLLGLHTANVISGDFSLGATGFLVEGGRKGRPVRKIMLAGNVCDFFKMIEDIGKDLTFFGSYGSPSLIVPEIQVNGEL